MRPRGLSFGTRGALCWTGNGLARHRVFGDDVECAHPVLPANLLALLVGAAVVADGHLVHAPAAAGDLRGDLGLEAEPLFLHPDGFQHLGAEGLVAGLHVREVQARGHVGEGGEHVVHHRVPEVEHPARRAGEAAAVDDIRLAIEDGLDDLGDVPRVVLEVRVLDDDDVPGGLGEAAPQGRALALVVRLEEHAHLVAVARGAAQHRQPLFLQFLEQLPAAIPGAVIHEHQLLGEVHGDATPEQLRQGGQFVVDRDDERDEHGGRPYPISLLGTIFPLGRRRWGRALRRARGSLRFGGFGLRVDEDRLPVFLERGRLREGGRRRALRGLLASAGHALVDGEEARGGQFLEGLRGQGGGAVDEPVQHIHEGTLALLIREAQGRLGGFTGEGHHGGLGDQGLRGVGQRHLGEHLVAHHPVALGAGAQGEDLRRIIERLGGRRRQRAHRAHHGGGAPGQGFGEEGRQQAARRAGGGAQEQQEVRGEHGVLGALPVPVEAGDAGAGALHQPLIERLRELDGRGAHAAACGGPYPQGGDEEVAVESAHGFSLPDSPETCPASVSSSGPAQCFQQGAQVLLRGQWMDEGRSQMNTSGQGGLDQVKVTPGDEPLAQVGLERIQLRGGDALGGIPETDDVAVGLQRQFEVGGGLDPRGEAAGQLEGGRHVVSEEARAQEAQARVELEGHHLLGALQGAQPDVAPAPRVLAVEEVAGLLGEGLEGAGAFAEEHGGDEGGHQHHLVRVPHHRVRALDALHLVPERRAERGGGPVGPIHVEPEAMALAEVRHRLQRIERTGGGGAGAGHHGDGPAPGAQGARSRLLQGFGAEPEVGIHGDGGDALRAPAHHLHGAGDAIMGRLRDEHRERRARAGAPSPGVVPGPRLAGGEQRGEVARGAARGEHAAAALGQAQLAGHPAQHRVLHGAGGGAHLVHGHAVVEQRGDEIAQRRHRQRGRHLVPDVAGVVQVIGGGEHALHEPGQRPGGLLGELRREAREALVGGDPGQDGHVLSPGGARQVVGELVHQLMALAAKMLRIVGGGDAVPVARHGRAP
ncbi:hypothetical protein STIAU_8807 [Stigmatella aurantiaca DW4/3-1]|uniref:Uncharacterized protein n=1 Tax=Stigmatella aurantiaca (strain DW4/3-1) TaxID=378806 RepID=Q09A44_STIAD|nr:hypothetical protein STIAU_8807 [Stigmatella aurantiaca DW4/3-1]